MNEENYSNKVTDLVEQSTMSEEYFNNAMSTFIPHLLLAFKNLIEYTPGLAMEFYQDVVVTYYGWSCLECSSVTENTDKEEVGQFIRNHRNQTHHTKGKWHEYDDSDISNKKGPKSIRGRMKKPVQRKVKDSISISERRKRNPDRFLFDNKTDVMGQKGIECNGTKGNRRWTHLSFYHSIERTTLLVKSYRSKWIKRTQDT